MVKTLEKTIEINKATVRAKLALPLAQPVAYDGGYHDLIVPENYEERMDWIRSSFNSFFSHVKERDALLGTYSKN